MALSAFLQKKVLFQPKRLPADHRFDFDDPVQEYFLDTPDGERLNALLFPSPVTPHRGVVLYFHGNRDNLQRWGAMYPDFTRLGYDFFAPDYRGYGKSTGDHEETHYMEDAELMYWWLRQKYDPEQIVLYGRSLGSGMASHLAARVPARLLILETPFDNIRGLVASHVGSHEPPFEPAYYFPNDENLQKSPLPLLIFHGTRDRIVPFSSANNLKKTLKPGDEFVTLEGGSHHNLSAYPTYQEKLRVWLLAERPGNL